MRSVTYTCDVCNQQISGTPTVIKVGWGNETLKEYHICDTCRYKFNKNAPIPINEEYNVITGFLRRLSGC